MTDKDNDIMHNIFYGDLKRSYSNKQKIVELGHGTGVGQKNGTYSEYMRALSHDPNKGSAIVFMGKYINVDQNVMSIVDNTRNFNVGDIPKILVEYSNIVRRTHIDVLWKDSEDNVILESQFVIPQPYVAGYDWWKLYDVYFMGPEGLEEGQYIVKITSKEDNGKTLVTTLDFSVTNLYGHHKDRGM